MGDFVNRSGAKSAAEMIFVALDVDTLDDATRLMDQLAGTAQNVKVGLQLATQEGWSNLVTAAHDRGLKIFCDAKFKDIPNTVEHAVGSLARLQPDFITVMADNSRAALQAARAGIDTQFDNGDTIKPKLIGVTVLTSISADDCRAIYGATPADKVLQFGGSAVEAGFDAIVCSPEEVGLFRQSASFGNTILITPGVRPLWAASNDQNRAMAPAEAIAGGADMLVIGRPITQPPTAVGSPKAALERIINEIEEAIQ